MVSFLFGEIHGFYLNWFFDLFLAAPALADIYMSGEGVGKDPLTPHPLPSRGSTSHQDGRPTRAFSLSSQPPYGFLDIPT